jgi:hypothetical protein
MRAVLASIVVAAAPGSLHAEPGPSAPSRSGALVAAKLGGIVPFDGLSPFVSFGAELGYRLGPFAVVVELDYTQPTKAGTEVDPRVTGGAYRWTLTEQELAVMPLVEYRFHGDGVVPYVGIGPRVLLARSTVKSDGAPAILATHEQSTRVGVGAPVGGELSLGPGRAFGELLIQYGTLSQSATGTANSGAATLSVGYRMAF